jgi:hypothetical protein
LKRESLTEVADELADLRPYPRERYANVDLDRLTAFGVNVLVTRRVRTSFENIVVALFRLFPEKFALVGFPQYPDAARVNRALLHGLPKYRNYLVGGAGLKGGYHLTHDGAGAAEDTARLLDASEAAAPGKRQRAGKPRSVADSFMQDITNSDAFQRYTRGDRAEVTPYLLHRMLHGASDTPEPVLRKRMSELREYGEQTDRADVLTFLDWAAAELGFSAGSARS